MMVLALVMDLGGLVEEVSTEVGVDVVEIEEVGVGVLVAKDSMDQMNLILMAHVDNRISLPHQVIQEQNNL
jgi:hypothetical protein